MVYMCAGGIPVVLSASTQLSCCGTLMIGKRLVFRYSPGNLPSLAMTSSFSIFALSPRPLALISRRVLQQLV